MGLRLRLVHLAIFGAALGLALPASSLAAKPFTLDADPGASYPAVAVDSQGTAHAAWNVQINGGAPDPLRYCQVPRGKRSCAKVVTLNPPIDDSFAPPAVLLPGDGQILLLTSRCCNLESGSPTFLYTSTDGGSTFAGPVKIGDNEESGDAVLGPGPYSASTISATTTSGVTFQTMPLNGGVATVRPRLGEQGSTFAEYNGSIAFVDPLTPIIAASSIETGDDHVYFRRFNGGTAYNDINAWGPLTDAGVGDESELAGLLSGKQGVHLLMRIGTPGHFRLVERRYDGTGFGGPTGVSETGDPIFSSFFMDGSGRLHAIWINNEKDSLVHRAAPAGKPWKPIETLIGNEGGDGIYHTVGDAAPDGGGLVIWDGNGEGPVKGIPFGPTGPAGSGGGEGGGDCVEKVKAGGATVTAQEGCLKQDPQHKSRYSTAGDVRVNGIDLVLGGGGGSSASASGAVKLTVDTNARTLTTTAKVEAKVGNVVLGKQELEWKLPAGQGQITDLAGNPAEFDTGKAGVEFLGLDVSGYTIPKLDGKEKVEIPINLDLPAPFDSLLGKQATGSATLRATNEGGLELSGLKVHIENVAIGIALVKTFNINYVGDPFLLQGDSDILLPAAGSELGVAFGFREGGFDYGKGEFTFPPGSLVVATDVLLRKIRFEVQQASTCAKPTKIGGGVTLTTGPDVAGTGLISVDGNITYSFPRSSCGTPGILDVDGAGSLAGIPVAQLHSRFTTDGLFTFSTAVDFDVAVAAARINLDGGIDIPSKTFYAEGKAAIEAFTYKIASAETIVSSVGMAACAPVPIISIAKMGFEYRWGETPGASNFDAPPDCDVDMESYKPAAFSRPLGARASAASGGFKLPGGLPSATVSLGGSGAPPGFILKGPGGLEISYPSASAGAASGAGYAVVPVSGGTFVKLKSPKAGSYTVTGAAGPAVTSVAVAHALPEPKVSGKVLGGGSARTLSFKARPIEGQKVLFVEQGKGVKNVIATSDQRRGSIHFRPALGGGRKRTVLAIVSQGGLPRAEIKLDKFKAPPSLPGRPRGVKLRRAGKKLVISWKRVPGAARVAVGYSLADGRRLAEVVKGHRVVIANVPGIDSGKIEIAGLRRDNVAGKSVKVKLKAKPKRRPHGKHRHRHHR